MRTVKALVILAAAVSSSAHASAFERAELAPAVLSGFVSHHFNTKKHFNENNYGVGFRTADGVLVGYYRNSHYKDSVYAAYEARWKLTEHVHYGVVAGGVTGYRRAVTPLVMPEVVMKDGKLEVAATYAPKVMERTPALVAMQVRWSW